MYSFLIGVALKSTAAIGVAWLVAVLMRKRSAALRHVVWTAAFATLLLLPLLSVALPSLRVPAAGALASQVAAFRASALASPAAPAAQVSKRSAVPAGAKPESIKIDWPFYLALVCAVGAAVGLGRVFAGWGRLMGIRRNAQPLVVPELPGLKEALGIDANVRVLETSRGSMPLTFGLLNPVIFMPADAADWSEERRRMVLLHELAHVRRYDTITHLFGRAILSLYWWNPLARAGWRRFLKERERAADDLVLNAGARASDYAAHLLDIARSMQSPPGLAWAGVAMARPSQLEGRLLAILDASANRNVPGRASAWLAAALAVILIAPLAALQAPESPAPSSPADVEATIRAARSQRNFEMLDKAAKAAAVLRQFETARKLLEASLAVRGEISGQQSGDYGAGLINLAGLEERAGAPATARKLYEKAASVLGERKESAPALMRLGIAAFADKDPERALLYFSRAKLADPARAGTAAMWTASALERQGKIEEAEASFKEALSLLKPDSAEAATTLELYAQFLRRASREAEAGESAGRASEIRKALGVRAVAGSNVYKIGGGVTSPQLVQKVEPEYTDEARAARYEGTVVLAVEIGADGLARNMSVTRGLGLGLDEKAMDAISRWKFKPGTKDGQPVAVLANIEVNYRLM